VGQQALEVVLLLSVALELQVLVVLVALAL
jgi:hypothetical protein